MIRTRVRGAVSEAAAWAGAWAVTALLIAAVHYTTGDPDSRLYAGISERLAALPVARWIAPEWWGLWGLHGLYYEHPVGLFAAAAAFARTGYPAAQAAFAMNALYQVISFALIGALAGRVVGPREGRAVSWLVQLIPIAFVFRIRANQEYAVLAGILLALYGTERAIRASAVDGPEPTDVGPGPWTPAEGAEDAEPGPRAPAARSDVEPGPCAPAILWLPAMIAGCLWVLAVKGVFALQVPIVCALWLAARSVSTRTLVRQWRAWLGLAGMVAASVVFAAWYDAVYAHATGHSFIELYRSRQVPEGALTEGDPALRTLYTLVWYLARVVWYAFPWSLAALAGLPAFIRATRFRLWRTAGSNGARAVGAGAWFAAAATVVLMVAFSLAHRKADRYIFPVYFIAGAAGAAVALRKVPALARVSERFDRPWVPAAVYVLLVLVRIVTRGHLPEFTFWRS